MSAGAIGNCSNEVKRSGPDTPDSRHMAHAAKALRPVPNPSSAT